MFRFINPPLYRSSTYRTLSCICTGSTHPRLRTSGLIAAGGRRPRRPEPSHPHRRPPGRQPIAALLLILFAGISGGDARPGDPSFRLDDPPFDPEEALATFEIADGFEIELLAAEPLVADPVDMDVDEHGRLHVLEMPGYPLNVSGTGRIKRLVDDDGDGYPDRSIVFADGFRLPTGILRWKEGWLITDAPAVLYVADEDGEGRADRRDVVLTGFALSNPQHNLNNPLHGLDNGIYLANNPTIHTEAWAHVFGDVGSPVRFPGRGDAPALGYNASGRIVRFRPDRIELEEMSASAQFGHDFDPWGRHFLVSNAHHQYHEVIAARYLRRNPDLPVSEVVARTPDHGDAAEVFPITIGPEHQLLTDRGVFTSAAGLSWYAGGAFPEVFDRVTFVTESVHNLVHADLVEDAGATFVARRLIEDREFLASTDSWFRPVNTAVGPDGALYVVDYYRKIVEHPEWMDEATIAAGRLDEGADRGRIYRVTPRGAPRADWLDRVDLGRLSDDALVAQLGHPNRWWRLHAQRLLVDRSPPGVVDVLARMAVEGETPFARLHALWTLEGMDMLDPEVIRGALSDPVAGIRENAIRLGELLGAGAFEDDWLSMTNDPDARVRFRLLLALGDLTTDRAEAARDRLLRRDLHDPWVQVAALTAASMSGAEALERAVDAFGEVAGGQAYVGRVAALIGASGTLEAVRAALALALTRGGSWQADVLTGLASGFRRRPGGPLQLDGQPLVEAFFWEEVPEVRRGLLAILRVIRFRGDVDRAMAIAAEASEASERRVDMLALVEMGEVKRVVADLRTLIRSTGDARVQAAAVRVLGGLPESETGQFLLEQYPRMAAPARDETLDTLLQSESRVHRLLDAVESKAVGLSALGWNRRVRLMRDWEGDVKMRARALLRASDASRADVVRTYEAGLASPGDVQRGEAVYYAACARCHGVAGSGAVFGPDLGTVRHWSGRALLDAILVPDRTIADGYELQQVERRGGETVTGILESETLSAMTLVTEGEGRVVIPRAEVEALRQLDGSPMPTGLEEEIDVQEMADLIAFLRG